MRRRHFLALLAPALAVACGHASEPSGSEAPVDELETTEVPKLDAPTTEDRGAATLSSNAFAFELYGKVRRATGNRALSPLSVSTALTMTWAGARGETADQMGKVLHLAGGGQGPLESAAKVAASLQSSSDYELTLANRLFGDRTVGFEPMFLDVSKRYFGAPLAPLDFVGDLDGSRRAINEWTAKQTQQKIKDLIPDGALAESTRLVLVNATYFLAAWETPFEASATTDRPFSIDTDTNKPVPTMHGRIAARFVERDGAKLVSLPYKGKDLSMVLVVPNDVDGLEAVEASMTADSFKSFLDGAQPTKVDVALPKFEIDPSAPLALASVLAELGMPLLFDRVRADLTGIANPKEADKRLSISQVLHKAYVKIDEKGTEAAAATAVLALEGGVASAPELRADRPFAFYIVDDAGLVLFMGRVVDPSQK